MKKNPLSYLPTLFKTLLPLCISTLATAQIPDPAEWAYFVTGSGNPVIRDTFCLQTFSAAPGDNWKYTVEGRAVLFDATEAGIANQAGRYSLKLEPGDRVSFSTFSPGWHTDIQIYFRYAAKNLMKGENLLISAERLQSNLTDYPACTVTSDRYTLSYPRGYAKNHVQLGGNPTNLILRVAASAQTAGGFYCLDSVYACGQASRYSLFTGTGRWEETAQWSHGVPGQKRDALVQGELKIEQPVSAREIALADGAIDIRPDGRLQFQHLSLYAPVASGSRPDAPGALFSEGHLDIAGSLTVQKTFPAAGQWYFISFPFDVYPEGIDPDFVWQDDKPNPGGNYFYVCRYNGRKRAETRHPSGNWEIIRPGSHPAGLPLFEKNKGYLIALDAACNRLQLAFSSRSGDIPADFGHKGQISLQVFAPSNEKNDEAEAHDGWCLCGNPFPASLSLSLLSADSAYEPFLYIFNGKTYQAYPLGSDYSVPPYAAFFLKAKTDALITWTQKRSSLQVQQQIPEAPALPTRGVEPERAEEIPTSFFPEIPGSSPSAELWNNALRLRNMPSKGTVQGFAPSGKLFYTATFPAGSSTLLLPVLPAAHPFALLLIRSAGYQKSYKYRTVSQR